VSQGSEERPIYDLLRVGVGCVGYTFIDPAIAPVVSALPNAFAWIGSGIAIVLAVVVSWVIFNIVDIRSTYTFSWLDARNGSSYPGDVVDIGTDPGQRGQIVHVIATRESRTRLSRLVFRYLERHGLKFRLSVSQAELRFVDEALGLTVSIQDNQVDTRFASSTHAINVIPSDLGLRWDGVHAPELLAHLRYEAIVDGPWWNALCVSLFVKISPTVNAFRKVQANA
jgi:hypothetical protein